MAEANERLRSFIERIERLEKDKKAIADDIREVYGEAKGEGYDTKILRQVVAKRKLDPSERQEQEALLDLYLSALGDAPLFGAQAADFDRAGLTGGEAVQ